MGLKDRKERVKGIFFLSEGNSCMLNILKHNHEKVRGQEGDNIYSQGSSG